MTRAYIAPQGEPEVSKRQQARLVGVGSGAGVDVISLREKLR